MCGIAGLIGWTGTENQISGIIKKFQSSLHHRGPDNKGHWVSTKEMISLVHTRLSIWIFRKVVISQCIHLVIDILFHSMEKFIII